MMISIIYLLVGVLVGFLIKHEIDIKSRRKRIEDRMKYLSSSELAYSSTLEMVRELNISLMAINNKQKEVQ